MRISVTANLIPTMGGILEDSTRRKQVGTLFVKDIAERYSKSAVGECKLRIEDGGKVSFPRTEGKYILVTDNEVQAAFEEHKDAVYRFAWRMLNSPAAAEDVAQDVFLALLRQPGRFDPSRGRLRSFLLGITRNLVLKRWRDENQWEELGDEQLLRVTAGANGNETALIVAEAVRALPVLQREALILAEYEELSLEEIARAVESEVGTVKSRLHRARENLRRMLAPLKPMDEVRSHGTVR
jgi:RNA polymerase sigma-70 factor (ECF subfamily)